MRTLLDNAEVPCLEHAGAGSNATNISPDYISLIAEGATYGREPRFPECRYRYHAVY